MPKTEPRKWLQERWSTLIPRLERLGLNDQEEIKRICQEEMAHWKNERNISLSSMRVPLTDTRNRIEEMEVTDSNRWYSSYIGKNVHIAYKYMNFTEEEWYQVNFIPEEKIKERQEHQQLVENPAAIVAKAEKLLESDRWYDLTCGIALVTGRRLTEVLKSARFFPQSIYTVVFDGQLKKREDINVLPYEIPTLAPAEAVMAAWRRLRSLVDCTDMDNRQVEEKFHKDVNLAANRHFAGLIPQQSERENLSSRAFRAVYAHIARLWWCPIRTSDMSYVNAILGHWQAKNDEMKRQFAATEHYFDYALVLDGQIDGRRGIRLQEPGVQPLEVFKEKEVAMTTTDEVTEQEEGTQEQARTKAAKKRGTLTTTAGTFDLVIKRMHERGFQKHEEIVVDLLSHDNVAHQLYPLLEPLQEGLGTNGPIATLQALVVAYETLKLTQGQAPTGMGELLHQLASEDLEAKVSEDKKVKSKDDPIGYLQALVDHNRRFKLALRQRDDETAVDYSKYTWSELNDKKVSTRPGAATERYRRAVNAIIANNLATSDPFHWWFINSAIVRDLVGGRNEKVREYLLTRAAEIERHHNSFSPALSAKTNNKNIPIGQDKDLVARLEADPEPKEADPEQGKQEREESLAGQE
jgi:hypothetical protein